MTSRKSAKPKAPPANRIEDIVGEQVYSVWIDMLRRLVPEGRTHRLGPTIAAMLQYAAVIAFEKFGDAPDEDTVAFALIRADEAGYDEGQEMLLPIIEHMFRSARVPFRRTSASGEDYSVAEQAAHEYMKWFNMPWED